jgi:hypothetical protein
MSVCRGCGDTDLSRVLDLGNVPAADNFPVHAGLMEAASIVGESTKW